MLQTQQNKNRMVEKKMSAVVQHNISLLVTISIDAVLYKQAASLPVNITSNQTDSFFFKYKCI